VYFYLRQSVAGFTRRPALTEERCDFDVRRRSTEPLVGRVGRRWTGFSAAQDNVTSAMFTGMDSVRAAAQ